MFQMTVIALMCCHIILIAGCSMGIETSEQETLCAQPEGGIADGHYDCEAGCKAFVGRRYKEEEGCECEDVVTIVCRRVGKVDSVAGSCGCFQSEIDGTIVMTSVLAPWFGVPNSTPWRNCLDAMGCASCDCRE